MVSMVGLSQNEQRGVDVALARYRQFLEEHPSRLVDFERLKDGVYGLALHLKRNGLGYPMLESLPPVMREMEAHMREIRPGDFRYGNPEENDRYNAGAGLFKRDVAQALEMILPRDVRVVPSRERGYELLYIKGNNTQKDAVPLFNFSFYDNGVLARQQILTAELSDERKGRTSGVNFYYPGDLRDYSSGDNAARDFAKNIKKEIVRRVKIKAGKTQTKEKLSA